MCLRFKWTSEIKPESFELPTIWEVNIFNNNIDVFCKVVSLGLDWIDDIKMRYNAPLGLDVYYKSL